MPPPAFDAVSVDDGVGAEPKSCIEPGHEAIRQTAIYGVSRSA